MALFKYSPPSVLEHFPDRPCIRFTPACDFNDPFEFLVSAEDMEDPKWVEEHWRMMLPDVSIQLSTRAARLKLAGREREVASLPTLEQAKQVFVKLYAKNVPHFKRAFVHQQTMKTVGVCCLTRIRPDSRDAGLPWGHYADSHKGFTFALDETHPFMGALLSGATTSIPGGPVNYVPKRVRWRRSDEFVKEIQFAKNSLWTHENEVRLFARVGTENLEEDGKKLRTLMRIPADALESLTFGVRCDVELKRRVYEKIKTGPLASLLRGKLFQAELSVSDFTTDVRPFEPTIHLAESITAQLIANSLSTVSRK